jgi:hypothetical protein
MSKPSPVRAAFEGHEIHRLPVRGLTWFAVLFVASGLLMHVLLWWLLGVFARTDRPHDVAPVLVQESFPSPRTAPLQPSPGHPQTPWKDLAGMRQEEARALAGATDQPGGRALTIGDAMHGVIETRRLTTRPAASTQPFLRTEGVQ